jgi:hypothetical protein
MSDKFLTDHESDRLDGAGFAFSCRVDGCRVIVFPIIDEKAKMVTAQVLELQEDGTVFAYARGYSLDEYKALPKAKFIQTEGPGIKPASPEESAKPA